MIQEAILKMHQYTKKCFEYIQTLGDFKDVFFCINLKSDAPDLAYFWQYIGRYRRKQELIKVAFVSIRDLRAENLSKQGVVFFDPVYCAVVGATDDLNEAIAIAITLAYSEVMHNSDLFYLIKEGVPRFSKENEQIAKILEHIWGKYPLDISD